LSSYGERRSDLTRDMSGNGWLLRIRGFCNITSIQLHFIDIPLFESQLIYSSRMVYIMYYYY